MLRLSDSVVSRVPVVDCGERLVPLAGLHRRLPVDDSIENIRCVGRIPLFEARAGVAARLVAAAERLAPGMCLLVKESLRPMSLQASAFERRVSRLVKENPALTREAAIALASEYVAPPWVAGHPTGGAVDLTLCHADGREADMGCAYDADETASEGLCFSHSERLAGMAKENRHILFSALNAQGFVNYPFEWWHWSYGDRYWAASGAQAHALYDAICP
jgi:D-alanyl-D-alanine dipeptidase